MDKLPEIGEYALIKDKSRWQFDEDNGIWLVDGIESDADLDEDDLEISEMAKCFGDKILVAEIVGIPELPELLFLKDENDYIWDSSALDRIVNENDDPEHFI